ncbi:hypothetical protein DY000_02046167 [Brassica cretica]|uniref:PPM-type phosphatase domain-containing protein n=1 Tax=Brassica cretica TaxID=69181 RepID=A0ABQ7F3A6_BRACR|nr:hypothetical protein DY000_02046167 [Brassica cretica]
MDEVSWMTGLWLDDKVVVEGQGCGWMTGLWLRPEWSDCGARRVLWFIMDDMLVVGVCRGRIQRDKGLGRFDLDRNTKELLGRQAEGETFFVQGEFWVDPRRSILKAYEKTDQAILSNSSDLGRGGSTAVTAILINGRRLWIANVGDSRALLSQGGRTMQMSTDHEPRAERSSIEDRGGFVSNLPGDVPRVNGQLAVSRAFGDKGLKTHLSSEPDIRDAYVDNQTDVLVLASDGIWKVMSNEEAMEIARRVKDPQKAAKELTAEALRRESKDDISCVVVRFR